MLHVQIVGHAVATAKHPSLEGCKLVLCQQLDAEGKPFNPPFVAVDQFNAGLHQHAFVSTDGIGARERVHDDKSPIRMFIQGLMDDALELQGVS